MTKAIVKQVQDLSQLRCGSCRRALTNSTGSVEFPCPGCEKGAVVRCFACRQISVNYECAACGFKGPN